jgi:hypothetical protein
MLSDSAKEFGRLAFADADTRATETLASAAYEMSSMKREE